MGSPAKAEPAVVRDDLAVVLVAEGHPEATLPQVIKGMLRIARQARCSVRSTWNSTELLVHADDTYQGAQRRLKGGK